MSKYANLGKSLKINQGEKKLMLNSISLYSVESGKQEIPYMMVRPSGEVNKPYFNRILKLNRKAAREIQSGNVTVETLQELREIDRSIFFDTKVITGWGDVYDSVGIRTDFSKENWEDWLSQIPNWVFDIIRNFSTDNLNFIESCDVKGITKN
jgi:hypothetical protein